MNGQIVREHGRGSVVRCPTCGSTSGRWWFEDPVIGKRHWEHLCTNGYTTDEEI